MSSIFLQTSTGLVVATREVSEQAAIAVPLSQVNSGSDASCASAREHLAVNSSAGVELDHPVSAPGSSGRLD